jgi:cysteine-rich repeat protein
VSRALAVPAALVLAACPGPQSTECGEGGLCPPNLECRFDGHRDVCAPAGCGNAAIDSGEDCDDGNVLEDDFCDSTCRNAVHPPGRTGHGMAYDIAGERSVLFGGFDPFSREDLWQYDGTSWAAIALAGQPTRVPVVYDSARHVFVSFHAGETWEWDGTEWIRRASTSGPPLRLDHAMAYDAARRRVVVFGGTLNTVAQNDTFEWDGTQWVTAAPPTRPPGGGGYAMTYDPVRQRVVAFGGTSPMTWLWDGADWTGIPAPGPWERTGTAMTFAADRGRVVLFGGVENGLYRRDDTWEWDGATWTEHTGQPRPEEREGHALGYDPIRQEVILFGGRTDSFDGEPRYLADTWRYDGTRWRQDLP